MDFGDAAVFDITEPAHQGQNIESELVIGQGELGSASGRQGLGGPCWHSGQSRVIGARSKA